MAAGPLIRTVHQNVKNKVIQYYSFKNDSNLVQNDSNLVHLVSLHSKPTFKIKTEARFLLYFPLFL